MTTTTEFVYVIYISTTAEKVWDALQDAEMTKLFWGRSRNVSDWQVGSTWTHGDYDDPGVVDVVGKIVESEPPKRLVLTWQSAKAPTDAVPTRVTYLIESVFGAVRLTISHDALPAESPMYKGVSSGWPAILSSLKTLLETGAPMPMTTRRWGAPPS